MGHQQVPSPHRRLGRSTASSGIRLAFICIVIAACSSEPAASSPTSTAIVAISTTAPSTTTAAATSAPTTPTPSTSTLHGFDAEAARALVDTAMQRLWIERDPTALDEYWAPDYVEHTMQGDQGRDWLRTVAGAAAGNPDTRYTQLLSLAEGDLVLSVSTDNFTGPDVLDFDLVRVADGKIAELWDATGPLSTTPNASGHTSTDGLTAPIEQSSRDANRTLIGDYLQTALVEGRWDEIAPYFHGNDYIQHSSIATDGVDSVRAFFVGLRDAGNPFTYSETRVVLADGNYVLAVSRGDFGGTTSTYWDLFRVHDGAIAEHWDVIEAVPAAAVDRYFSSLPG